MSDISEGSSANPIVIEDGTLPSSPVKILVGFFSGEKSCLLVVKFVYVVFGFTYLEILLKTCVVVMKMRVLRTHLRKKPTIKVVFGVAQYVYVCNCTLVPVLFVSFFSRCR